MDLQWAEDIGNWCTCPEIKFPSYPVVRGPFDIFEHVDSIRTLNMCNEPLQFQPHAVANPNWGIWLSFPWDLVIRFAQCQAQVWENIQRLVNPPLQALKFPWGFVCTTHCRSSACIDKFSLFQFRHSHSHGIWVNIKPNDRDTGTRNLLCFFVW